MVLGKRIRSRSSRRILAAATVVLVALGVLNAATDRPGSDPAPKAPAVPTQAQSKVKPDTRVGELPERRTATSATRRNIGR